MGIPPLARTGHGRPDRSAGKLLHKERRLNYGLQTLPSGLSAFPAPRNSDWHRNIGQSLPELWSDFSTRGHAAGSSGHDEHSMTFHGTSSSGGFGNTMSSSGKGLQRLQDTTASSCPSRGSQASEGFFSRKCVFAGFAEFDMDGRVHTGGEMDRIMMMAVSSKYPCSRPASIDEYVDGDILNMPARNHTGRDVVFVGPRSTGSTLFHSNTLGAGKCFVPPGDAFDGTAGAVSIHGRKCAVCVYPMERVRRQPSLVTFGSMRRATDEQGKMRRAASLGSAVQQDVQVIR
mmetsp:Transcript_69681/g.167252  ORF Transcript_69681/g.167252 Transcript_69681/m.167252 type:complete len:288 (+) Transcript_69681:107-970(+)